MKTAYFKLASALTLSLLLSAAAPAVAKETSNVHQTLKAVRAPELPAKAAELVMKAPGQEQEAVTIAVVQAAIALRPASAAAVVGAIARVAPHRASLAASTAITLLPKQAGEINKAILSAVAQQEKSISTVAKKEVAPASGAQAPPTIDPPFVPIPPGSTEITPGNTTPVPPGGRNYSAP